MGRIVVSQFITLDGVFEDPGGSEQFERGGWAFEFERGADGDQFKLDEVMASDALLLGRVTYEGFAAAWPSREGDFADKFNGMPKYVVSTTLGDPEWNNSTVIGEDIAARVAGLKSAHDGDVLVNGSAQLIRLLLDEGLVDELRLMVFPILLGAGQAAVRGRRAVVSSPRRIAGGRPGRRRRAHLPPCRELDVRDEDDRDAALPRTAGEEVRRDEVRVAGSADVDVDMRPTELAGRDWAFEPERAVAAGDHAPVAAPVVAPVRALLPELDERPTDGCAPRKLQYAAGEHVAASDPRAPRWRSGIRLERPAAGGDARSACSGGGRRRPGGRKADGDHEQTRQQRSTLHLHRGD